MKMLKYTTFMAMFCVVPVFGESFLTPTQFPKTVNDLSFAGKMDLLMDSYAPYEIVYDDKGVCISGCAYPGVTIREDMAAIEEATAQMQALIEQANAQSHAEATAQSQQTQSAQTQQAYQSQQTNAVNIAGDNTATHVYQDWCHNGLSTKLPLRYPVDMTNFKYKIASDFGYRTASANGARFHPALDIACPTGTRVVATADGVVETVANQTSRGGAGYYINIRHENGLVTQYLHLSKQLVHQGQQVKACDVIAISGGSGTSVAGASYAPHLDYRIRFATNRANFVDILCPCRASTQQGYGTSSNTNLQCAHSLFNAPYKFKSWANRRSQWRVEHGHCLTNVNGLLPDEIHP